MKSELINVHDLGTKKKIWVADRNQPPEHRALTNVSSCNSVDRAFTWCSGGWGFHSCWELRFFLCPTPLSCLLVHFSHFITELKIHHLYSLILKIFLNTFYTVTWLWCSTWINILQNLFYNLHSMVRESLSPGIIITQFGKE